MKSYTDLEQSKKLAEILPLDSADMYYECIKEKSEYKVYVGRNSAITHNLFSYRNGYMIPCWSLAALLEFMPNVEIKSKVQNFDSISWYISSHDDKDYNHIWVYNDNLLYAAYEMILKLHELNLL